MNNDPILQEIWDARQKIWEECEGSSEKLFEYYSRLEKEHSYKIVRLEQVEFEAEESLIT
ncbi:MAG: hypothetical protein JNN25_00440 [Candidatus Kapabacteria bacterium]|nr:hypothetical protein [Candidatus Kapabacteria bacterium]